MCVNEESEKLSLVLSFVLLPVFEVICSVLVDYRWLKCRRPFFLKLLLNYFRGQVSKVRSRYAKKKKVKYVQPIVTYSICSYDINWYSFYKKEYIYISCPR